MDIMNSAKDTVVIEQLCTVIQQLVKLLDIARENKGKVRPIIYGGEVELIKDHLDLVVKYSKI